MIFLIGELEFQYGRKYTRLKFFLTTTDFNGCYVFRKAKQ